MKTENDALRERIRKAAELADEWLHEARGERMVPVSALQSVRDALRFPTASTSTKEADHG